MKQELTPKIIFNKKRLTPLIFLIFFSVTLFPIGLYLIFINFLFGDFYLIQTLMGILCLTLSILPLVKHIKNDKRILRGEYEIHEDILRKKDINRNDPEATDFKFYFENYYKATNRTIAGNRNSFMQYHTGDKFYIVTYEKTAFMFSAQEYQVSDPNQLKPFVESNKPTVAPESAAQNTTASNQSAAQNATVSNLTKDVLKKDFLFKSKHLKTIMILVLCNVFLAAFILFAFNSEVENTAAPIVVGAITLFFLFFLVIKVVYVLQILSRINHDEFKISTEKIIKIGEVNFADSSKFTRFKTEKYNKYIYAEKAEFPNVKEGDYCHIVLVKKEDAPLYVYNPKKWIKIN